MKILAFETSAKAASVAITDDGKLIGEFYINIGLTHSETMLPMCEKLLGTAGYSLSDIDTIAVAAGPGSFTGIRIGIAAVKGLAFGRDIKCAAVSTLEAAAYNVSTFDGYIAAVMDARCNQVYNAVFTCQNGRIERITPDRALPIAELEKEIKLYKKQVILVGDGAELCYNAYQKYEHVRLSAPAVRFQRASSVAAAAEEGPFVTAEELEAFYLRLPQAERELISRQKNKEVTP
ncbi:MAG: tRNA (adenosine(37)-N6)-threonylcarbamoyltransferase complex dimerization subunit type 1 TsaB [Bacillota bacterium]|nr:tRNA (adenosine(37)-N6)-threonylcarbamoyltransferase complex dimerization subunit type 1 TsaB [Bacillota bacterium]